MSPTPRRPKAALPGPPEYPTRRYAGNTVRPPRGSVGGGRSGAAEAEAEAEGEAPATARAALPSRAPPPAARAVGPVPAVGASEPRVARTTPALTAAITAEVAARRESTEPDAMSRASHRLRRSTIGASP